MAFAPGTTFGPYEVLALIGAGGMGEVYRARDPRLGRDVAIKTIAPHLARDPEVLARFRREARSVAALSHPNILAIHDVGQEGDTWFVVTELLAGETLRHRMRRGPLAWSEVVAVGVAVAEGLASAHARGIVHRDIKPENLFITSDERVKILDFGLARPEATADAAGAATTTSATAPGTVAGTAGYMSPEQIQAVPLDGRTDIFSLGCVLYEMLAGAPPFRGASPAESAAAVLRDPVAPLAGGAAPPSLEQAIIHCLEKNREVRFQSAMDLAFALKAASGRAGAGAVPGGRETAAPRVAVLPFRNLSADPENDYFADGVTEDVIAHLAKLRSLDVISRASVAGFKKRDLALREIGRQLGVATVLDGSVRRAGNRVRIVAELIDTRDDRLLWADTYDRDLTDIFAIQTDVALRIAGALHAELSPDERSRIHKPPTLDLEAYALYVHGRQLMTRHTEIGLRDSLTSFERAIARDPDFALAHVGLARTYMEAVVSGHLALPPHLAFARAKEAIARALAADDRLGDAHGIAALIRFVADLDWSGAEQAFQRALELSPGSADIHDYYGWLCSAMGRSDDAIRLVRRAAELDPLAHRTDVASELLRAGRFEEALAIAQRVMASEPGFARGHSTAGWAYLLTGRAAEGLAALERAVAAAPGSTLFLAQLAQGYAMTGDEVRARALLTQLTETSRHSYVAPYHFAYVYTGLGDADTALDWLERAYAERAGAIYGVKGSFLFASLRAQPRFQALLKKMNLA
ncbi:MAG: protein kinase [Acidobacteriota bacterium]